MSPYHLPSPALDLSVVVPLYNERDNVEPLVRDILREVGKLSRSYEVILVNDGSNDGTAAALDGIAAENPQVKVIHLRGNQGQTIALGAGMYYSAGKTIVLMDGDRQNDPADIGPLVDKLGEGYACVSGWRRVRHDSDSALRNICRKFPSQAANLIVRWITGVAVHDLGCTLKAYTREALDPTELFGEMHRFLAVFVQARGGRLAEVVVRHHPRGAGVGKYGLSRTARVIVDLALIRLLFKYRSRPSHLFANVAQWMLLGSGVFGFWWLIGALRYGSVAHGAGAFLSALMLGLSAIVLLACGLVTEVVIRNRFALSGQPPWKIAGRVNWDETTMAPARAIGD